MPVPPDAPSSAAPLGPRPPLPPELDPRGVRPAPRRRRRGRWIAGGLAAAVLVTSGGIYGADRFLNSRITRIDPFHSVTGAVLAQPAKVNESATNILLVGSDSRQGMSRKDEARLHVGSTASAEGQRADTMMLLHIGPGSKKAVLISFPRDSYVEIPAHTSSAGTPVAAHKAKINDAYAEGGPALAIETVAQVTGIHIDHYVEINFLGFERMVNALGGVTVCAPRNLVDKDSGLDMTKGVHKIDGEVALKYARARHIDSDFGRIGRQQALLASLLRQTESAGTLANPLKVTRLVDALLSSVTVDKGLSQGDMLGLAQRLKGLSASRVTFAKIPVTDDRYDPPGPVSFAVLWDPVKSAELFQAVRDDQPLAPETSSSASPHTVSAGVTTAPSKVRVQVLNGAGVPGLAKKAAADLAQVGFQVAGTGNAARTAATAPVIRYDPRWSVSLQTLQASLPGATAQAVTGLGGTFQVVVPAGWSGARKVTAAAATAAPTPSSTASVETKSAADTTCA